MAHKRVNSMKLASCRLGNEAKCFFFYQLTCFFVVAGRTHFCYKMLELCVVHVGNAFWRVFKLGKNRPKIERKRDICVKFASLCWAQGWIWPGLHSLWKPASSSEADADYWSRLPNLEEADANTQLLWTSASSAFNLCPGWIARVEQKFWTGDFSCLKPDRKVVEWDECWIPRQRLLGSISSFVQPLFVHKLFLCESQKIEFP